MGDAGTDAEKADEKPWDKDEDEEAGDMNEKNESGPSVVDKDTRELRAKGITILTDSMDLPSGSNTEMNLTMTSLASGETLTDNIPKTEFPQDQASASQLTKVNPFRNVGDALNEWKERVRVSADLGEQQEAENEMKDPDAGEYGYDSQFVPYRNQTHLICIRFRL